MVHTIYIDDVKVEYEEYLEQNILSYRQVFNMHYINAMQSAFENMTDYIKIWCAILINDWFHDLYELVNLHTTWQTHNAPLHLSVELDGGMDVGTDRFFLDSYRDEL